MKAVLLFCSAAAATAVVVTAAAVVSAAAATVAAAAAEDYDKNEHPAAASVTEKVIVTHKTFPPLIDYIPYYAEKMKVLQKAYSSSFLILFSAAFSSRDT